MCTCMWTLLPHPTPPCKCQWKLYRPATPTPPHCSCGLQVAPQCFWTPSSPNPYPLPRLYPNPTPVPWGSPWPLMISAGTRWTGIQVDSIWGISYTIKELPLLFGTPYEYFNNASQWLTPHRQHDLTSLLGGPWRATAFRGVVPWRGACSALKCVRMDPQKWR